MTKISGQSPPHTEDGAGLQPAAKPAKPKTDEGERDLERDANAFADLMKGPPDKKEGPAGPGDPAGRLPGQTGKGKGAGTDAGVLTPPAKAPLDKKEGPAGPGDPAGRLPGQGDKGKGAGTDAGVLTPPAKARGDEGESGPTPGDLSDSKGRPGLPGDAILQSFQSPMQRSGSPASMDPGQSSSTLSKVAQEITDRILVSDMSRGGGEEVRISLKDSVMPGTEIRISKEGGKFQIEILTTSNDSLRLLSDNRGNLEQSLKERIGEHVGVAVKFRESEEEHRDGRSRQQRNLYEEMEE